jgi:hypothetical protein
VSQLDQTFDDKTVRLDTPISVKTVPQTSRKFYLRKVSDSRDVSCKFTPRLRMGREVKSTRAPIVTTKATVEFDYARESDLLNKTNCLSACPGIIVLVPSAAFPVLVSFDWPSNRLGK